MFQQARPSDLVRQCVDGLYKNTYVKATEIVMSEATAKSMLDQECEFAGIQAEGKLTTIAGLKVVINNNVPLGEFHVRGEI